MKKIKEIKIVNQDQSTEVANIGADAINVDYNDTTVKAELDKLNINSSVNKNTIASLDDKLDTTNSNLALQTSRIDSLAHLKEGSTTGDAELIEARVNYKGLIYDSIGNSIRASEEDLENLYREDYNWARNKHEHGGYNGSTGAPIARNAMVRTKKIQIQPHCDYLLVHLKSNEHFTEWGIQFQLWEADGTYVNSYNLGGVNNLVNNYQPFLWAKPGEWVAVAYSTHSAAEASLDIENENIEIYQKSLKDNDDRINLLTNGTVSNYLSYCGTRSGAYRFDFAMNAQYPQVLIKVNPGERYYANDWGAINGTLDKNKNLIAGYSNANRIPTSNSIWTVPEGVRYLLHDYAASGSNKILTRYLNGNTPVYTEQQAAEKDGYMPSINLLPGEEYVRARDLDSTIEDLGYIKVEPEEQHILKNKIINLVGDSITSTDYTRPNWGEIISSRTGCIINNYGISGTTLAHTNDRHLWDYHFTKLNAEEIGYIANDPSTWSTGNCFCERYTKIDGTADAIVVMGGTNDGYVKLGNWDDTDISTFYGALNKLIPGLLNNFPGKPILFCTMMQSKTSYSSNVIDPLATLQTKSSTDTLSLQLRAEAIKAKCKQYGMACLDLYNESGINGADTNAIYFKNNDNLHPSAYGQLRLANLIQHKLEWLFDKEINN